MFDPGAFSPIDVKRDRRSSGRIKTHFTTTLSFKNGSVGLQRANGVVQGASPNGFVCATDEAVPGHVKYVRALIDVEGEILEFECTVIWKEPEAKRCGVRFSRQQSIWWEKILQLKQHHALPEFNDRRQGKRRESEAGSSDEEKRKVERRFIDLWQNRMDDDEGEEFEKAKMLLRNKAFSYTPDVLQERRDWLSKEKGVELNHVAVFSEPFESFKGKIEDAIGVTHMPLGIAGPLKINGKDAKGNFYVPLATTEGALVSSYSMGMNLVTRSGGVNTHILQDELRVSPVFIFESLKQARVFTEWIHRNFKRIKEKAESTTQHGKLLRLEPVVQGHRVILKFWYSTGDAMGMNMICKATDQACRMIVSAVKPVRYFLRSNYSSNKKIAYANLITGYGKTVTADAVISRQLLQLLNVTPELMESYYQDTLQSGIHAGMIGSNGHFANGITAMYIACGQDVATVANSSAGISFCEVNPDGDLYVSVHVPNLLVGTVGGGTEFGTMKECLQLLDCYGNGKAKKFAEIVAAVALVGEISICASIVNGTYVEAHELYGRNKPH